IWYQGENNANSAWPELYGLQLPLLIADWRHQWGQARLPFAWVQLPNFQPKRVDPAAPAKWALVREAMLQTLAIPDTGMAVAIDIGEAGNIHPKNKREVGRRLSLWARARVYGESIPYSGPLPRSHTVRDGRIIITFGHADGGLVAQGGAVKGFEVAGADRRWVPAEASLQGDQVIVTSPQVPAPSAVRYAWADNPECNLFNGAGLPASPFRTDDGKP
ncbi:MAG: sialate O-acetylesterase, partial [Verrucomicrobia bacterium]|nr:sialate O-acetylesterase [Verrucomicrobiota bacterium]